MIKPTLLILAAGMGSRYGGLKQLDGVGPNGETIMDYSVFDAMRSGFGKVVFVIRSSFEGEFLEKVVSKYKGHIPVEIVFQELNNLPEGFQVHPEREKPWGTNHAIMMGKNVVKEPFAVINADDFYGQESFQTLADHLNHLRDEKGHYCMVGYRLKNTLSESGHVSRGVCEVDQENYLRKIEERTQIQRIDGIVKHKDTADCWHELPDNSIVSMNMWGFTPDYFDFSEEYFIKFLEENQSNHKAEFYIPVMVEHLLSTEQANVKVLDTPSKWFGVTYADDRPMVVEKLKELHNKGEYPEKLW